MGAAMSVFAATAASSKKSGRAKTAADGVSQTGDCGGGTTAVTNAAAQDEDPFGNLCGLEPDGVECEDYEGPQRVKECTLTAEEQAKFRAHLDKIFSQDTIMGKRIVFEPSDVLDVVVKVIECLQTEPMLIEDVPFGVTIVGDLHGQLYDLDRIFRGDAKEGKRGYECTKYVFLGDYVDRGRQSLEIVMALFCLKCLYPDNFFLLRGNHEFVATNSRYGFANDMYLRYAKVIARKLYVRINQAFCYLSVGAIVGNYYFCSHGGVSTTGFTRRHLKAVQKPYFHSQEDIVVHNIIWSDPAQGLRGTTVNKDRGTSFFYGFDTLVTAMQSMNVKATFRAHSRMTEGFGVVWNCCITIFSATDYGFSGNDGAVALVDSDGKVSFRVLKVDQTRSSWEKGLAETEAAVRREAGETTPVTYDLGTGKVAVA